MDGTFISLDELEPREILPGASARFVHSPSMTMAFWSFEEAVDLPEHSHPHEQITTIIEGEFELTVDGVTRRMRPGDVAVIGGGAVHSGRSITRCRVVDVFHPVREDFR